MVGVLNSTKYIKVAARGLGTVSIGTKIRDFCQNTNSIIPDFTLVARNLGVHEMEVSSTVLVAALEMAENLIFVSGDTYFIGRLFYNAINH
jgi:hypothetical protein